MPHRKEFEVLAAGLSNTERILREMNRSSSMSGASRMMPYPMTEQKYIGVISTPDGICERGAEVNAFLQNAQPSSSSARWERTSQGFKPHPIPQNPEFDRCDGILLYSEEDKCFYVTEFQGASQIHEASVPEGTCLRCFQGRHFL